MPSSASKLKQQALKLPATERFALALVLWDSMSDPEPEVTAVEKAYAESRLAEHRQRPDDTISWTESRRRLADKACQ